jgi:DNA (cytosine-5)-methyltransferase 1
MSEKRMTTNGEIESPSGKNFAEFFTGIGLVDEGLRPSGWRCVYANDNDPSKKQMYESRNGPVSIYHLEDVSNTAAVVERIPDDVSMATASFPCIDLSLAGHYRGFEGKHSSVFFAFLEVLKILGKRRPKIVSTRSCPAGRCRNLPF